MIDSGSTRNVFYGTYSSESIITVTGGTYNKDVTKFLDTAEYRSVDNGDGTYTVRKCKDANWIYSAPGSWESTGTWEGATLGDEKVTIETNATYTASAPSANDLVTMEMTLNFNGANDDDVDLTDAKAAVRLAEGSGGYVFQLATTGTVGAAVAPAWADTTGFVPQTGEGDYTFLFVLNLATQTYTASVITDAGATTNALTVAGSTTIAFANYSQGSATAVREVEFIGSGTVTSIVGSYEDAPAPVDEFVNGQEIGSVTLDTAQAAWLNGQNNYAALRTKIESMSQTAFDAAYLLNLDILSDFTYEFKVSDITVGDTTVSVKVTLTRNGEIDDPIIGTLKLTGTDELGHAFTVKDSATISDAHFSAGDGEVTISFPKDASTKFFQPVIE